MAFLIFSYDSEGRLTNVTFPTGVITSLIGEMDRALTVDIETSGRDDDVSITTNLSSIDSFYTLVQGAASLCCIITIKNDPRWRFKLTCCFKSWKCSTTLIKL